MPSAQRPDAVHRRLPGHAGDLHPERIGEPQGERAHPSDRPNDARRDWPVNRSGRKMRQRGCGLHGRRDGLGCRPRGRDRGRGRPRPPGPLRPPRRLATGSKFMRNDGRVPTAEGRGIEDGSAPGLRVLREVKWRASIPCREGPSAVRRSEPSLKDHTTRRPPTHRPTNRCDVHDIGHLSRDIAHDRSRDIAPDRRGGATIGR